MCSRPFRPLGLPIYVARGPAAPFTRRYLAIKASPARTFLCRRSHQLGSADYSSDRRDGTG